MRRPILAFYGHSEGPAAFSMAAVKAMKQELCGHNILVTGFYPIRYRRIT